MRIEVVMQKMREYIANYWEKYNQFDERIRKICYKDNQSMKLKIHKQKKLTLVFNKCIFAVL